jgi:hypothetical protein
MRDVRGGLNGDSPYTPEALVQFPARIPKAFIKAKPRWRGPSGGYRYLRSSGALLLGLSIKSRCLSGTDRLMFTGQHSALHGVELSKAMRTVLEKRH